MRLFQNYNHSSFRNRLWFNLYPNQLTGGVGCYATKFQKFIIYHYSFRWDTWVYKSKLTKIEPNNEINN